MAAGTDDAGQGFVAKIEVDGRVSEPRWFEKDHRLPHASLRGPSGVHVFDFTVFVTDVDRLLGIYPPGVTHGGTEPGALPGIQDVSSDGGPGLLVSISAPRSNVGTILHYGSRAAHDDRQAPRTLLEGRKLEGIRGVASHRTELFFVTDGSSDIFRISLEGSHDFEAKGDVEAMPRSGADASGLDGLALVGDGRLLVTSHGDKAVYLVTAQGAWTAVASGVDTPADVAVDPKRQRFLVASTQANRVEIHSIPAAAAP